MEKGILGHCITGIPTIANCHFLVSNYVRLVHDNTGHNAFWLRTMMRQRRRKTIGVIFRIPKKTIYSL